MTDAYQFAHIFAFYSYQSRMAYGSNNMTLGDSYEKRATAYFRISRNPA